LYHSHQTGAYSAEQSLLQFSFSEEIDESLLTYVDTLIKKELQRSMGPAASDDDERKLVGVGKETITLLKLVKKRLEAEIRTAGRSDIRLLSKLLNEESLEVSNKLPITSSVYGVRT
jgi:hypothetical protein